MNTFTEPLEVRFLGEGLWQTMRQFTYWSQCRDDLYFLPLKDRCKLELTVPEGFVTDFASIPSPAWPLIGHPAGDYVQAAVLHDWLYHHALQKRSTADRIFLEAMEVLGIPWWKRTLMWMAVRTFGFTAYRRGARK